MINTNELRLGNKVLFRGEIDTVTEIGIGNGYCRNNGYFNDDKGYVEPVALSPEILQACGFHYLNSNTKRGRYYVEAPYIGGELKSEIAWWPLTGVISINSTFNAEGEELQYTELYLPHIKYLHQLMNLWHSLTGTELTINLEKVKV